MALVPRLNRAANRMMAALSVLSGRSDLVPVTVGPKREAAVPSASSRVGAPVTIVDRGQSSDHVDSDGLFEEFLASRPLAETTKKKYRRHYAELRDWLALNAPGVAVALARRPHLVR